MTPPRIRHGKQAIGCSDPDCRCHVPYTVPCGEWAGWGPRCGWNRAAHPTVGR